MIAEGSALTLTAVPVALGAVLAARVRGPAVEPAFLDVRGLSVRRGPVPLRRITLRADAGECVAVFGAGSRTLLTALAGNVPARGRVRLGGADLAAVPAGRRMPLGLCHLAGPVPDTNTKTNTKTAADERTVAGRLAAHAHVLGHADPAASAGAVLEVFPALHRRGADPAGALGPAERELLGLAEALLTRPRLLLVDGVVAGPYGEAARTVLRRLAASGTAVVVTGRPVPAVLDLVSRAYVLDRGRVAAELVRPTPDQVLRLLPGNPDAGDAAP
ncbi:ATP-binding cassette domain-containing protein [Spirillospora sp. NPDC048819]|uniref:ATP-binding cassette domain-containing protein n=1 Tax=Spirillospora sp. NPDC048819 TaxID=3155268 RepID=UPI0034018235